MQFMQTVRFRRIAVISTGLAVVTALACSDQPTAVAPGESSATSDFVASGMMYNALFVPGTRGLELSRSDVAPLEMQTRGSKVHASLGDITPSSPPEGFTKFLARDSSAFTLAPSALGATVHVLRTRRYDTHTIDGKRISVAVAPDDDRRSGRPAKATLVLVNDRIAAITEYRYSRQNGAWRITRTRTTFIDSTGAIMLASETDLSGLVYRAQAARTGARDRVRSGAQAIGSGLARIVVPDVLHAAEAPGAEESCWQQVYAVAAANAALVAAGAALAIAIAAEKAAQVSLAAATAACIADPATCAAVPIAAGAVAAAQMGVTRAVALLVSAGAVVAAANTALSECLRDPVPPGSGGGGGDESADCEEWCEWSLTFSGDTINVKRNYCWCEYGDGAT